MCLSSLSLRSHLPPIHGGRLYNVHLYLPDKLEFIPIPFFKVFWSAEPFFQKRFCVPVSPTNPNLKEMKEGCCICICNSLLLSSVLCQFINDLVLSCFEVFDLSLTFFYIFIFKRIYLFIDTFKIILPRFLA